MSEEVPALTGRTRLVVGVAVGLVVAAGLLLRFWTRSGLWLDEALTVDIARLPLHDIPDALKHDGAPPLYYYLLHFWMVLFGQSNDAVRALSGLIAVATLPVAWLCGRRLGGRAVAWTMLVLLASAPFAVYFATESRMYALVILLTGCGFLALARAVDEPASGQPRRGRRRHGGAALHAVLVDLPGRPWSASGSWSPSWRSRRQGRPDEAPWAALIALAAGCLLFVPWVPTFVFQAQHTGTPWAATPNFSAVINVLTGFTDNQGSTQQTGTNQGRLLAVIYFAMLALAVFGVGRHGRIIELDLRTRPRARGLGFVVLGTLFAAIAGGILTGKAFSSRYAAVVFLPFLLLVALGTTTLLNPRVRVVVVGLAVVAGLVVVAPRTSPRNGPRPAPWRRPSTRRPSRGTSSPSAPTSWARPSTARSRTHRSTTWSRSRAARGPPSSTGSTTPRPCTRANPGAFAADVAQRAGTDHHVWLVWESMYKKYGVKCEPIETDLLARPPRTAGAAATW